LAGGITGSGAAVVPSRYFKEFPNAYLTTYTQKDEPAAWLATDLPSLDDGTWKVLSDGRMEVTWKIYPGVKWQDGADLTSDDIVFSWEIQRDPATQIGLQGIARYVQSIATPDPYTAVFTWASASQLGSVATVREFDILPRHVLEGADRGGLVDNPYFVDPAAFVGSGPYRPTAWDRGRSISLEAFDQYFLSRPHIDRVTFETIADYQAALVNVLAGQVDVGYWAVSFEGARIIQQEWAKTDGGSVDWQANNARHFLPQLRPDSASPRDLTDVRVRKALMYAMDRAELAETAATGAALVVNSTTYPDSVLGQLVEQRAVRYEYDPARAAAVLAEVGWQKGTDGFLTKGGERFQLSYRVASNNSSDWNLIFPVLQQQYRRTGIELIGTPGSSGDQQADALFPGLVPTALPDNQTGFLA
jgi:peptide/nickel transport system substrate-binding protein